MRPGAVAVSGGSISLSQLEHNLVAKLQSGGGAVPEQDNVGALKTTETTMNNSTQDCKLSKGSSRRRQPMDVTDYVAAGAPSPLMQRPRQHSSSNIAEADVCYTDVESAPRRDTAARSHPAL